MIENIFEYIKILLPRHKCVTLPGLGAFILNKDESDIFDARKVMNPPSYSITFNSMLQHDDGTLSSYIQALRGTSYDKASKDLAVAVREMRAKLLVNKEIPCSSLGKLALIDSTIVFTQNKDYISPIHFGLSSIGLKSIATISQSIEKETKTISLKKKLITVSASAAAVLLLTLLSTSITDSDSGRKSQQAGFLHSLVADKTPNAPSPENKMATITDNVEVEETTTEIANKPDTEFISTPVAKAKSERTYYLIIGGEPSASRASNALRKFEREGFDSARILASAERHRIYIQTFDNKNDAEKAVIRFRQQHPKYASAWVHSVRN